MSTRLVASVSLLGVVLAASGLAFGADVRTYISGNYFLTIEGAPTGFIKGTSGGGISAQVINETPGSAYFVGKHIGQPRYEPLIVNFGFSNGKTIYEWIKASWSATDKRKNLSIDDLDHSLQPKSVRAYSGCSIAETTIPALDASSKEPAYVTIKLGCESMRTQATSSAAKNTTQFGKNEQKVFLPSNFKLEIDGLNTTQVTRIDSFTVKRAITSDSIGQGRDSVKQAAVVEFPNLKITITESGSTSWKQWFDDFVVKGNNSQTKEKSGTLTLLTPNREKALAIIKFSGIGIYRLESADAGAASDTVPKVTAELYVEGMVFEFDKGVIG